MTPAEHIGQGGEVLATLYEGQELELIAADGKPVFIEGTQNGFNVVGEDHFGEYGPNLKKAYLQLQFSQVLRPIALDESSIIK